MTTSENAAEDEVTAEIVVSLYRLVEALSAHFDAVAAELGLTPTQALAIRFLGEPTRMGRLAGQLRCERSNVTAVVDRLEQLGHLERRPAPDDRRARLLVLTPRGRALRRRLTARLFAGVPAVAGLSDRQRRQLRTLLRTVTASAARAG